MALDPQAQALLDAAKAAGLPPVYLLPVPQARQRMEDAFRNPESPLEMGSVSEIAVPSPAGSVTVRAYFPSDEPGIGCLVFVHGGGWTLNSLDTHDLLCRQLAKAGRCAVLSVDHRRAPEHKHPAALEDVFSVLEWAFDNGDEFGWDSARIGIGGDSSGGTLSAAAALLNRDRGGRPVACQLLIYPVTDYFLPGTASYQEMATGYSLNRDFMIWFWTNYIKNETDLSDPYLCPLKAEDFSGLPPALILTAEYDPLRDEGAEYGRRLQVAGVEVKHMHFEDQMHGFMMQTRAIDRAREALRPIGEWLQGRLGE